MTKKPMTEQEYADRLGLLNSEALVANRSVEFAAAMIERLANALGFTVAIAANGDPKAINTMMEGAVAHAMERAVDFAPTGRFMQHTTV